MESGSFLFTSESVTEGHPDKVCDFISDSILDACLEQDKESRVAVETFVSKGKVVVAGQITTLAIIDIEKIVREKLQEVEYDDADINMDYRTCDVEVNVTTQSREIASGVDIGGAGDQGIMFGFACDETENYMPYAIDTAHKLSKRLSDVRKNNIISYLKSDGKVQVTVEYKDDIPYRLDTILISVQHEKDIDLNKLRKDILDYVILNVISKNMIDDKTKILVNPLGEFVIGGPVADTGLTGRKIIVDTYGGYAHHGGGAFSGKDATKVDRSAAYMLRYIAKNIVANGYAKKCELQVSYGIGLATPISIYINTFGTNSISNEEILELIKGKFDLTPQGIIRTLELNKAIYSKTTNYGHFGRDGFAWEKIINI